MKRVLFLIIGALALAGGASLATGAQAPHDAFITEAIKSVAAKCPSEAQAFNVEIVQKFMHCTLSDISMCRKQFPQEVVHCSKQAMETCRGGVDAFLQYCPEREEKRRTSGVLAKAPPEEAEPTQKATEQPRTCERTSSRTSTPSSLAQLVTLPALAQEVVEVREQKVRITSITGDVRIQPRGKAERAAIAGEVLCEGDELFAGFDSSVIVKSENNTTVSVRPNTQIRIATFAERKFDIRLEKGEVRTVVKTTGPTRPDVRIQTPTATTSVRGTEFDVRYDEKTQETYVGVFEGHVEVAPVNNALKPVTLAARQEMRVSKTLVTPPQTLAQETNASSTEVGAKNIGVFKMVALGILALLIVLSVVLIAGRKMFSSK